ncbi:MAG: CarD family transcriptional regulator [Syntrophomonadaceae bacterium]|nr:CarD family transcriptional regulator [Syntrophomonadaceae bacterium]MDD4550462.1 CarD family transcriptional regulator [Syntrophomonadaceae bacterium]
MFKVNDYVVYGSTGICQITDIRKDEYSSNDETEYYILKPVYNDKNMTIKFPVNNPNIAIRPILTKDEALSLIMAIPEMETIWIDDNRERSKLFKAILKTRKSEGWVKLVKTLYLEKDATSEMGKTLTKTDEDIMNIAEKHLNEELSIALNISPDEVESYILEHIPDNMESE